MPKKKHPSRVLFYAHFNKLGHLEDYVVYQLQQMRGIFDTIVFVSNSPLSATAKQTLGSLCDHVSERANVGYDFAAWRDGMTAFGWDALAGCDEVTVMNDTCFGPIFDFSEIHSRMQSRGVDFWGMTTNLALTDLLENSRGETIFAPEHIQSYYMTFNAAVVSSPVFTNFWKAVEDFDNVMDVIDNYEIRLTQLLHDNGFSFDSYYDATAFWGKDEMNRTEVDISAFTTGDMTKYNPGFTCNRPLWLLETVDKYPFIKTKFVRLVPAQLESIRTFITDHTSYPVQLIDSYIGGRYYDLWQEKDADVKYVLNSNTFKAGKVVIAPFRLLKRLVTGKNPDVFGQREGLR